MQPFRNLGDGAAFGTTAVAGGDIPHVVAECIDNDPRLAPYREDVESEARLMLLEAKHATEPADEKIGGADNRFAGVLSQRCRKFLSKDGRGRGLDEVFFSEMPDGWEPGDAAVGRNAVRQTDSLESALESLDACQLRVIRLLYFEELSPDAAARQLGITESECEQTREQALIRLRVFFGLENF